MHGLMMHMLMRQVLMMHWVTRHCLLLNWLMRHFLIKHRLKSHVLMSQEVVELLLCMTSCSYCCKSYWLILGRSSMNCRFLPASVMLVNASISSSARTPSCSCHGLQVQEDRASCQDHPGRWCPTLGVSASSGVTVVLTGSLEPIAYMSVARPYEKVVCICT
jgi:hypothetical protein